MMGHHRYHHHHLPETGIVRYILHQRGSMIGIGGSKMIGTQAHLKGNLESTREKEIDNRTKEECLAQVNKCNNQHLRKSLMRVAVIRISLVIIKMKIRTSHRGLIILHQFLQHLPRTQACIKDKVKSHHANLHKSTTE